jgi:sucrose phosphorylase
MGKRNQELRDRLLNHLQLIYPDENIEQLADQLIAIMGLDAKCKKPRPQRNLWNEQDVLAITYADSFIKQGEKPLVTLEHFLTSHFSDVINSVHILPFYPWSSDDGFSVINYKQVNDNLGDWEHIERIARQFRLMSDLVINHCSSRSQWFENFKQGRNPGADYFIEVDPETDLSEVVRPRTNPLLCEVETSRGARHVWCTFSHDQMDLNFANPQVLLEIVDIVRYYLDRGVRIFRLDAVAFLWKEIGTNCLNLAQTHEMVRLLRSLIEHRKPKAIVITETNIPNRQNLAYFGNGNEAHVIYNFALPPLLLHGLITGNNHYLNNWLMSMPPAQDGTTYLNFIASHDGIGLRPVEGILDEHEIDEIAETMQAFGGRISWRNLGNDQVRPYEINISLIDALGGTVEGRDDYQVQRFICAHAIMLALEGIPAFYIHSLLATENDTHKMEQTGNNRSINRHNWDCANLSQVLNDPLSQNARVLARLKELIKIRAAQPAFHPNATQYTLHLGQGIFAFWRQSRKRDQSVFCIYNISSQVQEVSLGSINLVETQRWYDLLSMRDLDDLTRNVELPPYDCFWITNR